MPEGIDVFPESRRIHFKKVPLIQVVAQVLFPTVLMIERSPADFQEKIRSTFPLYTRGFDLNFGPGMPPIPPPLMQLLRNQAGSSAHNFSSADRQTTVTLTSGTLSLTTGAYTTWEAFASLLHSPLMALIDLYAPAFFTRLGLRYINAIDRDKLGLAADFPWSRLIRREVLGELAVPAFENNLDFANNQTRLILPNDEGAVTFQHGVSFLMPTQTKVYTLDFDFSKEGQIGVNNAESILNRYHQLAGRAFRWCIAPELESQLGPESGDDVR